MAIKVMQQLNFFEVPDYPPIKHWSGFLSRGQADDLLSESLALSWHHNRITMFGKGQPLPRLESMFGDSESYFYLYSGSVELRAKALASIPCRTPRKGAGADRPQLPGCDRQPISQRAGLDWLPRRR